MVRDMYANNNSTPDMNHEQKVMYGPALAIEFLVQREQTRLERGGGQSSCGSDAGYAPRRPFLSQRTVHDSSLEHVCSFKAKIGT